MSSGDVTPLVVVYLKLSIMKFLLILSWILIVILPIIIFIKITLSENYKGSLSESIDRLQGYTMNYSKHILTLLIILLLAIVFVSAYS